MFGKRKTPVTAQPGADSAVAKAADGVGKLTTIIVPRSAMEQANDPKTAYKLVSAVVDYVNAWARDSTTGLRSPTWPCRHFMPTTTWRR